MPEFAEIDQNLNATFEIVNSLRAAAAANFQSNGSARVFHAPRTPRKEFIYKIAEQRHWVATSHLNSFGRQVIYLISVKPL